MTGSSSLSSSSTTVADQNLILTVNFTPKNALPSGGSIRMVFPAYSSTYEYITSSTPTCLMTAPSSATLACIYDSGTHTLLAKNIPLSVSGGTLVTFTVNSFMNPNNGIPRTSGFTLYTQDTAGGSIDYTSSFSLTMTSFALFDSATIGRQDTVKTVGESSNLIVTVILNTIPVAQSCRLQVDFPTDMPLVPSLLTGTAGDGFFSSSTANTVSFKTSTYATFDGCTSISPNPQDSVGPGIAYMQYVTNKGYVQSTQSFTVSLYAMLGNVPYVIAQATGITISDFVAGTITNFGVTPATLNVQSATVYTISMQPAHSIATSSKITIQFPSSITLNSGTSCAINTVLGVISSSSTCSNSGGTLTITNPFGLGNYASTSGVFSFTVVLGGSTSGTNPISAMTNIGAFIVNTYYVTGGQSFQIDTLTSATNLFTPAYTTTTGTISTSSTIACDSTSIYTLTINTLKNIPSGGIIQVVFPTNIFLTSVSSVSTCSVSGTGVSITPSCSVTSSSSPVTMRITGLFGSLYTGTSLTITLGQIINPAVLGQYSSSFTINSMDSSQNMIEQVTGLSPTMLTLSSLPSFSTTLLSSTNSASGVVLKITLTVGCPLTTGYKVQFTAPADIDVSSSTTCTKITSGVSSISCAVVQGTQDVVTATLTISSSITSGSFLQFTVDSITNPYSTCTSAAFTNIAVLDPSGTSVNSFSGSPTVKTSTTSVGLSPSLIQGSQLISTATTYTFVYTNVGKLLSGAVFTIGYSSYASLVTVPSSMSTCNLIVGVSTYVMNCVVSSGVSQIEVTGLSTTIPAGSNVQIAIGAITNPSTQLASPPSFSLTTYTDSAHSCIIDQISSGLAVQFSCNYPCFTCQSSTQKSVCTSCSQTDTNGNIYLTLSTMTPASTCTTSCGTGYYPITSTNVCAKCMTWCLTCTTATTCATCLSTGSFPVLYNADCIAACPAGFFQPTGQYTCTACDSTCKTCSVSATRCLTCDTTGSTPNFYQNTCLASCPSGYVAVNNVCTVCTSPCATCQSTVTNCLTCVSTYNFYLNKCYLNCPTTTVSLASASPPATYPLQCLNCGTNCATCLSTSPTTYCYTCSSGYYLYNNLCYNPCPTGTYQSVSTCIACSSNCLTCSGANNNNCLTCDHSGSFPYLSGTTCVSSCPIGTINVNFVCTSCTSPCLTCSVAATQCLSCISNYYLYNAGCYKPCPTTTVGQSTSPATCVDCGSNCDVCSASSPSTCTTCSSGYFLYLGVCYSVCPSGTYNSATKVCSACDTTCNTCSTSQTNCTSCITSSAQPYLQVSKCLSNCSSGYIPILEVCTQCTSPCLTCSTTVTNCQTCISGYLLYQNACYKTCPAGTAKSGSICVGCTTSCLSCSGSTCLQCNTGYYLYGSSCYKVCPGNTVANLTSQSCYTPTPVVVVSSSSQVESSSSSTPTSSSSSLIEVIVQNTTNSTDKPYVYFPLSTTQTILGGISVGSHFKDPTSMLHGNTLGLWAPLEFLGYAGQAYLAYVQEVNQTTQYDFTHPNETSYDEDPVVVSSNSTSNSTKNTTRRRILAVNAVSQTGKVVNNGWPLVFYGTAASFILLIVTNCVWGITHCILLNKDDGYKDHRTRHCCVPVCIAVCSCFCSYKMIRLNFGRFFGLQKFSMQPQQHEKKVQNILNIMTIVNMVVTLLPIVFVDIYGLITHSWGNQFYMTLIETLVLSLSVIVISIFEFKSSKAKPKDYDKLMDNSMMSEDALMKKIDDEIRKRLGGQGLDEFLERLKNEKQIDESQSQNLKGRGRSNSVNNLNRDLEEDDRRVHTDPIDEEKKKQYLSRPNPFPRKDDDPEHPNNCYAEQGRMAKKYIDPANRKVKVIQTGEEVMDGDAFDKEFEEKMKLLFGVDHRKDDRQYGTKGGDEEGNTKREKKKNKMRGRKDAFYQQVDNEDMVLAEEAHEQMVVDEDKISEDEREDEMSELSIGTRMNIAPEGDGDDEEMEYAKNGALTDKKNDGDELKDKAKAQSMDAAKYAEELKKKQDSEEEAAKKSLKFKQEQEEAKQKLEQELEDQRKKEAEEAERMKKVAEEEEKKRLADQAEKQQIADQQQAELKKLAEEEEAQRKEVEEAKAAEEERLRLQEQQELLQEDQVVEESKEEGEMINLEEEPEMMGDGAAAPEQMDPYNPKFATTNDMENQILQMIKAEEQEEMGEPDSDDDNEQRIKNMSNPELRKFNVHDILGEFDQDNKGNLVMLQNKQGDFVDKLGKSVNEKGYLIDKKTGDVIEKELGKKVFDKDQLDERGELPPPFNIERFNFNPHDVRGHFDRDPKTGDPIIGNKTNAKGQLIDKLGRRINEHGYLVDEKGNIVDKRGRIRLHNKQLDPDGNIPLLFTYKGKKFDVRDILGDFEKDRKGNIIIRRDKDNKMVDKKGRPVNNKGYLIDNEGNVINEDGKVMFESFCLSKDNEIPKFFPFLKFNVDDIKGDFEMDPLGNPMLQKGKNGELLDNKGRLVNEKGYLMDEQGNIKNKRGYKVFGKTLMETDGEIPKVFRTGLFRKDTVDSFSQLMNEIEQIEKMQYESEGGNKVSPGKERMDKSFHQEMANKIDKILEEDNDDDDMIMKELDKLAGMGDNISEGGNTSVDSKMEITPSDYNQANQRFMEQEQMRDRALQNARNQAPIDDDDEDTESQYMAGKKLKRRKKKPKKKKKAAPKEPQIDVRDLMMAQAYGGLSSGQVDKLIQERKRKEQNQTMQILKPPINKNASNSRLGSMHSRRPHLRGDDGDNKSEWGAMNEGDLTLNMKGKFGLTENQGHSVTNRNVHGKSQAKRTGGGYAIDIKKNNLMNSTQNSFHNQNQDGQSSNKSMLPRQLGNQPEPENNRDRRLSNIANSVSGFYREQALSEQSKQLRSTHESNFAVPGGLVVGQNKRRQNDEEEEVKMQRRADNYDPELERIYGAARGIGDITMLSDWEKDSVLSGQSGFSQLTGVNKQKKIRNLEGIYLQRLEPATKKLSKKNKEDKAKFRLMHHRMHDEPEWHADQHGDRDELDSVLSENYKQMEKKFKEEFHGKDRETGSRKKAEGDDGLRPNIFHGNFYQYKEQQEKKRIMSQMDFDK